MATAGPPAAARPAAARSFHLGGDVSVHWHSDVAFVHGDAEQLALAAHLPGLRGLQWPAGRTALHLVHAAHPRVALRQDGHTVHLRAPWAGTLPPDFAHLVYAMARRAWAEQQMFAVHAACVGRDGGGYALLAGAAGSGKTSLTLDAATRQRQQVFSADKTLVRFAADGSLWAIAGTPTLTLRQADVGRFAHVPKQGTCALGDRLAFRLPPAAYSAAAEVRVDHIFTVRLRDGAPTRAALSPASAVHALYPLFLDRQREDTLIGAEMALFDGGTSAAARRALAARLRRLVEDVAVVHLAGPLADVAAQVALAAAPPDGIPAALSPPSRRVLVGICGIGRGHLSRQAPVLQHLLGRGHRVLAFTYGEGVGALTRQFGGAAGFAAMDVANPYLVGTSRGLDFAQTATHPANQVDFNRINALAMARAQAWLGTPDLVISDYEQVSAQYAYAKGAPLVTLDQQSKYLAGAFAAELAGTSYRDEVERLRLFFPTARRRLAVSFFAVPPAAAPAEPVTVLPPMIRPEVQAMRGAAPSRAPSLLVYVTSQQLGARPPTPWLAGLEAALCGAMRAHVFLPRRLALPPPTAHVAVYHHGDDAFDAALSACHGVVSTAGHTLLSEALYLGRPVYAVPLPLYEQQLNAQAVAEGPFGIAAADVTEAGLRAFLRGLAGFAANIRDDRHRLLRGPGNPQVLAAIDGLLR